MNGFIGRTRKAWPVLLVIGLAAVIAPIGEAVCQVAAPKVIQVRIEHRKVVAPKGSIRISENDTVELRWSTDEEVEVHLHGYNKELRVHPGKPASMTVQAYATGRFPVTSHGWGHAGHGHQALTYIEVYPR